MLITLGSLAVNSSFVVGSGLCSRTVVWALSPMDKASMPVSRSKKGFIFYGFASIYSNNPENPSIPVFRITPKTLLYLEELFYCERVDFLHYHGC